ncbi:MULTISPECIES: type II toxin-antitoxin system RelE/ParE family toxin [Halomonadaceae]|uniref:Type II toxin-antitoxin system RelE/ParE family toxin n=1 Tax=Halomonas salipaludis TaxID=2032625 RepID=A0A2A2EX78_9GAMM|nr:MULTISPECIES: hypothetical protein [Halomonas]PAU76893.1 hypothetical protein CK498_13050 [Halomonas salipaludis]
MKLRLLDSAVDDLLEATAFYDAQVAGLGDYFIDNLSADIDSLRHHAGIHQRVFGFHRLLAKRFPFAIYYSVNADEVRVYAILDCRRAPEWIRQRLS